MFILKHRLSFGICFLEYIIFFQPLFFIVMEQTPLETIFYCYATPILEQVSHRLFFTTHLFQKVEVIFYYYEKPILEMYNMKRNSLRFLKIWEVQDSIWELQKSNPQISMSHLLRPTIAEFWRNFKPNFLQGCWCPIPYFKTKAQTEWPVK